MISALRPILEGFVQFLRTPTLGRRVAGLLIVALVLLLTTNIATFVMMQRTADFNDDVEETQQLRRAIRSVFIDLVEAETGQRGFLLTGNPEHLQVYNDATNRLPTSLQGMSEQAEGDLDVGDRAVHVRELAEEKVVELQRTIDLARTGRVGEALGVVRSNRGKAAMDQIRSETLAMDEVLQTRLQFRTRQSEWAGVVTVIANALGAILILVLGAVSSWLIHRYIVEIQAARSALDRMNAGLEEQVRDRTADLTRANEEIQRFAYIVSHDLRAPLVNVMGYTSELEQAGKIVDAAITDAEKKRKIDPEVVVAVREEMPEAIGFIRASTEKMDRLINAILKLSREGRRHLVSERIDMSAMAQQIADSVRHQTEAADAEIRVAVLPSIESDRLSMEQILGNLIDNAVKYLDPTRPGLIEVTGQAAGDGWATYHITDNGRGISDRDHERIFELFRRSGRQDRPGEGLGLAFVRNSVRRLGGEISVRSELGKGSTFTLKFPTRLILADVGDFV